MNLEKVYLILNNVLPNKVTYGTNIYVDGSIIKMPFIIYKEISRQFTTFTDNQALMSKSKIQVTLVTKTKDINLENKLEESLVNSGFYFALLSEYQNEDKSLNRAYEITMEEIRNGRK